MKFIQVILPVEDAELEKRIICLEERCKKIGISLDNIFYITAYTMPNKPFVDILLGLSDLKISDIERNERMKQFFKKFKIHKNCSKKGSS